MGVLEHVGYSKALRYLWYGWFTWLFDISLPPVRTWLLRAAGARVGKNTVLFSVRWANLYHHGFSRVTIGDNCFIGDDVTIDTRGGVTLEDHVTLSNGCRLVSHINVGFPDHPLQKRYPTKDASVQIRYGAYIGTGAIILSGVSIGRESIVAAGSVVTKNVPDGTLVAGVPAAVKKRI